MTKGLLVSLVANTALSVALVALISPRKTEQLAASLQDVPTVCPLRELAAPAPPPFTWSLVEADNYPAYVANLRSIGCPEQTIHDIIAADLASSSALADSTSPPRTRLVSAKVTAAQAEARTRLVRALMGEIDSKEPPSGVEEGRASEITVEPTRMPVLLANHPEMDVSEEQRAILADLREEFVASVGGLNQSPQNPAYLARWQAAQPVFDQRLRTMLGWKAYQLLQVDLAVLQ